MTANTRLLRTVARDTTNLLTDALEPLGLTVPQLEALAAIAQAGDAGASGADIARACHITPQTVNTVLGGLTSRGLVASQPAAGRRIPVTLTDNGQAVLARAQLLARRLETRLSQLLGAAALRRLADTSDALGKDLAGFGTDQSATPEDPRHSAAGNAALGLHYRCLMWAGDRRRNTVPGPLARRWGPTLVPRLLDSGLWKPDGDDYRIRD